MKSTAHIKTHPIHPMLIPFPIAFFIGAFVFDVLAIINDNSTFWVLGKYLTIAGIVSALAAAVPGIIDYFLTVPPESSAKKRATKHGLVNITAVISFSIGLALRNDEISGATAILALEAIGIILLGFGGWMGGTLVYRNHIGVVNRYASSGKWNEERLDYQKGKPMKVAKSEELRLNQMKLIHIDGRRIAIGRTEKGVVAFDDRCTHKGGSLAGGVLICGTVQCPWHGSQFDVHSGKVSASPAKENINTYKVSEDKGMILLTLSNL